MITSTLAAAVAAGALGAGPYHPPGHGIISDITSGVPLTNGNILHPLPYPYNRTRTTTFTHGGRLWAPANSTQRILSSLYPGRGPAASGAGLDEGNLVFFVRPLTPELDTNLFPDVALSPWQTINEDTFNDIIRRRPWLKRSPERTGDLIEELRAAQREFMRQQGLVAGVRTHVNARSLANEQGEKRSGDVEPSAIIRRRNVAPNPSTLRTSLPGDPTTRVSLPGKPEPEPTPRITVVRGEAETDRG